MPAKNYKATFFQCQNAQEDKFMTTTISNVFSLHCISALSVIKCHTLYNLEHTCNKVFPKLVPFI